MIFLALFVVVCWLFIAFTPGSQYKVKPEYDFESTKFWICVAAGLASILFYILFLIQALT